jgi:hypothetical protein
VSVEGDLQKATQWWSLPLVVRNYDSGNKGQRTYQEEAVVLGRRGYLPHGQTEDGGHVHVGRLLLTGGLSIFAGGRGIRSAGKLTVTFVKQAVPAPTPPPAPIVPAPSTKPDPYKAILALAELRDKGIVTTEEYEAKKAEILSRI